MGAIARRAIRAAAVAILVSAAGGERAAALSPASEPVGDWTAVGPQPRVVGAAVRSGQTLFLGGTFAGLARRAPGVAALDPRSGAVTGPRLDPPGDGRAPTVTAAVDAPGGGSYVAGRFDGVGGVRQPGLLRLTASGALDATFRPVVEPGSSIDDLAVGADGTLYVAGAFTSIGGQPRQSLAAVDGATGAVTAFDPAPTGAVAHVEVGASALYVAGPFTRIGGQARAGLASVSLSTGAATSWDPQPSGPVQALAVQGSTVYVGGLFTQLAGAARRYLGAVRADGAGAVLDWDPQPNLFVEQIVATASAIYVRGDFTRVAGAARRGLAALSPGGPAAALAWDPAATARARAMAVAGPTVYLGLEGGFPAPRIAGAARCSAGAVDAVTGAVTPWDPALSTSVDICDVRAGGSLADVGLLAAAGGRVWAVGSFEVANLRPRTGLAAIDLRVDDVLPWAPQLDEPDVRALAPSADGGTLYVGGHFASINGTPRLNAGAVAAAGSASSAADVRAWSPDPGDPGDPTDQVRALALSSDGARVYVGGKFATPRRNLAAVAAAGPGDVVAGWAPSPGSPVSALALAPGGWLFAAGSFSTVGAGTTRRGIAAIDAATGAVAGWDAGLPTGANVDGVAISGADVVLGGAFASVAGANLARFDRATAAPAAALPSVDGRVRRVAVDADGTLYLYGDFRTVGDQGRSGAAAVSPAGAVTGWDPAPSGQQSDPPSGGVLVLADRILLTGSFTAVGAVEQSGLAFFGAVTAPVPRQPPVVTGSATPGQTLRCAAGTWGGGGGTVSWAWLRGSAPIAGATGVTYVVGPEDRGHEIACRQTIANAAGGASQISAPVAVTVAAPAIDVLPEVAGEIWAGGLARCTTGLWRNGPITYTYRWLLDGVPLDGDTGPARRTAPDEEGRRLACEVAAANESGRSPAARSAEVAITEAPPALSAAPTITGTPEVGSSLGCDVGAWERARALAIQWLRDGVAVNGAGAPSYLATSRDLGHDLVCAVTASNRGGATVGQSAAATVVPSPHGTGYRRPAVPGATPGGPVVDVRRARLRSNGRLEVRVAVPAPGRLAVAVATRPGGGATAKALVRATRAVSRAQSVTVTVRLGPRARGLVQRAGSKGLRVTVTSTFQPRAGGPGERDRMVLALRAGRA